MMPGFGEVPGVMPGSMGTGGPLCPTVPGASPGPGGAEPAAGEVSGVVSALPLLPAALPSRRLPPRAPDPDGAAERHRLGEGHEPRRWTALHSSLAGSRDLCSKRAWVLPSEGFQQPSANCRLFLAVCSINIREVHAEESSVLLIIPSKS